MTLTASDVSSLSKQLSCWEYAEYSFASLVAVACAGEYVADFTKWFTGGVKEAKDRLAKRSTLLLIVALAFELVCLVKTNSLSGQLIGSLSDKAEEANIKAQSAIDKSFTAEARSEEANTKADDAVGKVNTAENAAGQAKNEADAVLAKADELRKQVVALSPRTLTIEQQQQIVKALTPFRYAHPATVGSYSLDGEGTALAIELKGIFRAAGIPTGNGTAGSIVTGGFEWGVAIRGPSNEMPFMVALQNALISIGGLKQVVINGPSPRVGARFGGRGGIGGTMGIGGGGGPPMQLSVPSAGPVEVFVGIRPPTVLPTTGTATSKTSK